MLNSLGKSLLRGGLLALLVAFVVLCALPAGAGWQDKAKPAKEEKADPAWDKYAFDLPFADDSGRLTFEDLARSDKPFILVFWLTDCPVCHMQLPYVQQLQKQIEDNKLSVRVVSICVDDATDDCLKYVKDKGITFDVLFDGHARKTDTKYHVEELGTPLTYVFKPGGKFVDYMTGFRSEYAKSVYTMLDIKAPASRNKSR
jgi:cytochrome oxidase Cu insertion factor (SCO1/SenC/PrrC family)